MEGPLSERDWKHLRRLHDEMLASLCAQINKGASEIASDSGANPHQQYLKLYRFINDADRTVAECFNDWRRSTIANRMLSLRRHRLLTDAHVSGMSEEAQQWLHNIEKMLRKSD